MAKTRRVGAHRPPQRGARRGWIIALGSLAAVAVLTFIGVAALDAMRPPVVQPSAPPPAAVVTDPSDVAPETDASITVLDASGRQDLAAGVAQALEDQAWEVDAVGEATSRSDKTVVWYDAEELSPIARGLVQILTVGSAEASEGRLSGSPITIVLGSDAIGVAPSALPSAPASESPSESPSVPASEASSN